MKLTVSLTDYQGTNELPVSMLQPAKFSCEGSHQWCIPFGSVVDPKLRYYLFVGVEVLF